MISLLFSENSNRQLQGGPLFATKVSSSCEAFSASLAASLLPLVVQVVPRFRRRNEVSHCLSVSFAWQLGEELAYLERQLSEQVSMDKSNAAMAGGTSLDSLQLCMRSVLQEMTTSSAVQPNMVDEARRHMEQVFMSLTALSQQSQTANRGQGLRFYRCCSATKCRFLCLERGAQTGQMLWAPILCDPAICFLGQCSWRRRPVARCTDGADGQSLAASSSIRFEREEKATWYEK